MLLPIAVASDFGRETEPTRVTRYKQLEGDGPVYGRWRNRRGAFLATRFPDGQIEHVDVFEGKTLKETRLYGADGQPEATVKWETESVVVHFSPPQTISLAGWNEAKVAGVSLRLPPTLKNAEGRWTAEHLVVAAEPAANPFDATFAADLTTACGCELEASRTVWIGGKAAAHYRLQQLQPEGRTADVIALSAPEGLLVLSATGQSTAELATLRAIVAASRGTR